MLEATQAPAVWNGNKEPTGGDSHNKGQHESKDQTCSETKRTSFASSGQIAGLCEPACAMGPNDRRIAESSRSILYLFLSGWR